MGVVLFLYFCGAAFCQNTTDSLADPPPVLHAGLLSDAERDSVLSAAKIRRSKWPAPAPLELFHSEDLGIRRLNGRYVDFYTDLPSTPETDSIGAVLDRAVPLFCHYFHLNIEDYDSWRVEAFLMGEREPFEIFGALAGAPEFANGYSLYNRIWVFDKKQAYYNRFLLLHELVHAFMDETFGSLQPRWYSEGIAEFLALHRLDGETLTLGIFPDSADEIPGFGRVDRIQEEVRRRNEAAPETIFQFDFADYEDVGTYAWSWAMVTLLSKNPDYADALAAMPYLMTRENPTAEFLGRLGERRAALATDWADFIARIDYGYDFTAARLDLTPGEPLGPEGKTIELSANGGGWQNARIALQAGREYKITASGRFRVFDAGRLLPCEANGITLRYCNGRPLGRLLATVIPAPPDGTIPVSVVGSKAAYRPEKSGTLYFRLNLPTGEISRAEGTLRIQIEPTAPDAG